ncbi:MAG: transketolase family protein [bacterium]
MRNFEMGLATRNAYGEALAELGEDHEKIVVLDADLSKSTKTFMFADKFPDRFCNVGIQEANMVGMAAGLASSGYVPFISSFACFLVCRAFDQMRCSIAYPGLNVKFVASHGGISGGEDGVTQQSVEDLALMLTIPDIVACVPADEHATRQLVPQFMEVDGPCYMRTGRPDAPIVYDEEDEFELGRARVVETGSDVTIAAMGLLVSEALKTADVLAEQGIDAEVIDVHTIKPLDTETLLSSVQKTGGLVVAEEHQVWGGLSSVISRQLTQYVTVPMEFVAIEDTYAESGDGYELLDVYGLTEPSITTAAETVLDRQESISPVS